MRFMSSRMSWRVKTSYSRYCRQPAIASVRPGAQLVCVQNSSMQCCVAARAASLSSAADSETEKNTDGCRPSASRRMPTQSTIAFWCCSLCSDAPTTTTS